MSEVLVFDPTRRHNGDLIAHAAQIGWLPEPVFDATYGLGRFWSEYKPETLVTNDLFTEADNDWDWRYPVHEHSASLGSFGAVVFDPPFKEQGTPSTSYHTMNKGYGVDVARTKSDLHTLLSIGAINCADLVRPGGFLLVKCMDQIVCGRFTSQTTMFREVIEALPGWAFESWLHLASTPRPQRSQVKPRNNYSTLLAFKRRR